MAFQAPAQEPQKPEEKKPAAPAPALRELSEKEKEVLAKSALLARELAARTRGDDKGTDDFSIPLTSSGKKDGKFTESSTIVNRTTLRAIATAASLEYRITENQTDPAAGQGKPPTDEKLTAIMAKKVRALLDRGAAGEDIDQVMGRAYNDAADYIAKVKNGGEIKGDIYEFGGSKVLNGFTFPKRDDIKDEPKKEEQKKDMSFKDVPGVKEAVDAWKNTANKDMTVLKKPESKGGKAATVA